MNDHVQTRESLSCSPFKFNIGIYSYLLDRSFYLITE